MANLDSVLWGRYRLLDVLGDGGMARVFQAEDERLSRRVAVKVLHEHYLGQPEFVRRFEQEAQLAAGLTHPNIVSIYDMGRDGDTYFIVMEYVDGGSLKAVIAREAPLPLDRVTSIMRQLGSALDYAHEHGVIHRDIKPENILLSAAGHVKVSDFGIARALTSPSQTATGIVLGSVSYLSPEQAQGQPATAQSDLYSSGVVLYEMLTRGLPFTADTALSVAMQHITQQVVPPRTYVPQLPPAVDMVVLKALSKRPIDRYPSGSALANALAAAAAPVTRAPAAIPSTPSPARMAQARAAQARTVRVAPIHAPPPRRRVPAVALLMLVLFGGGAGMYYAYEHRSDINTMLRQGSPNTGPTVPAALSESPTATATSVPSSPTTTSAAAITSPAPPTATSAPAATTPAAVATSSSTPGIIVLQPSATPATPSETPAATRTPVTPSRTPSDTSTPASTATATDTAQPTDHKHLGAEIVTASGYAFDGSGAPLPVQPSDTFDLDTGHAYAIIHINNLPKKASVGARWIFPNGKSFDIRVPGHYSSYWIVGNFASTGHYTVSALVNGKPVGTHTFEVISTKPAKHKKNKNKETPVNQGIVPAGELLKAVGKATGTLYLLSQVEPRVSG